MELRPRRRRSNATVSDEVVGGSSLPDMNEVVSSGEDNASDSSDGSKPSSKRGRAQSRKKRKSSNIQKGESSGVDKAVENRDKDENPTVQQQSLPTDLAGTEKKKNVRKSRKNDPLQILLWEVWEKVQERLIDRKMLEDVDLDNESELMNETAEASSDITVPLLRYQKEWLAWALKQENNVGGGMLADEMGMGKTIQAIALVLAKRELHQKSCKPDEPVASLLPCSSKGLPVIKATLVICPLVAATQWVNEIDRFTLKGSTKVLVYHGAGRGKSGEQFSEYDFVITTYSAVESEYRKNIMPPKVGCRYCGKLLTQRRLKNHERFCGPDVVKTQKKTKQGRKKKSDAIHSDMTLLHGVKWQRIILDEAHYIKSRHSNTTKGVLALESSYKWLLSGTPIQNRIGELYSLVRFLQIIPYSYYLCKKCNCKVLDHSPGKCPNCIHGSVKHFCWWTKYVAHPIQYGRDPGRRAMILLKHKVLKTIALRRTKIGRAADLALPPRIVSLRRDCLDIKEQDYYESLYKEIQAQFNTYVAENNVMYSYAHIFDLLTRLRQAVDHPYLVVYSQTTELGGGGDVASNATVEQVCGICQEPVEDPVVSSCKHVFCKACLIELPPSFGRISCPSCSQSITVDLTSSKDVGDQANKTTIKGFRSSSILNRIRLENFQTSTKLEALREEIRFMVERDGSAKGIAFSQFTSFLDLINYSLHTSGVSCVQLNGSMSLAARDAAIKRFNDDPDCKIFLMSLKAGGVALNLTVASHVFLMDPWWNPAVERQAQDRIHRIGQYKPIRIVKFIIENTVEERILKLQEKKELMFEGTIGRSSEALGKLTMDDMRFLFT